MARRVMQIGVFIKDQMATVIKLASVKVIFINAVNTVQIVWCSMLLSNRGVSARDAISSKKSMQSNNLEQTIKYVYIHAYIHTCKCNIVIH